MISHRERFGVPDRTREPWLPLGVLFALSVLAEVDQSMFNVLAPDVRHAFGLSNTAIVAVRVVLLPVLPAIGLAIGYLADRRRRTALAAGAVALTAIFAGLTGVAPALWLLVAARAGAGLAQQITLPTHQSLLADYYAPQSRTGVFSAWRISYPVGQLVGPLFAGGLAALAGWRTPFLVLTIPAVILAILVLRMPEPVRGVQERRARGASEEVATTAEEPPTWDESWRTVAGVRTLRRVWRALPFLLAGVLGLAILLPLYYDQIFHVREATRGVLAAAGQPFAIVGLVVGIPLSSRLLRTKPARLLVLFGACSAAASVGFIVIATAPNVAIAAAGSMFVAFTVALLVPGIAAIVSLVVPPRARSFAFSVNELWALPGLLLVLVAARIGDANGMRWAVASLVPLLLIGAAIIVSAGGQLRADIRAAQTAALADAEFARARADKKAKLLVCRGVEVHYGAVQVLFGVDLDVGDGEIVALLGTNGAGKSTVLKAIAGLVDPSGGAVIYDGRDLTHASAQFALSRGVVLMPGGRAVFPTLTVAENLRAAGWSTRGDRRQSQERVAEVLEYFPRLRERLEQPAGNLSGGEQQMLGLGMAFLARPRLLMIDELSLGLAPVVVEQLLAMVRTINADGTAVVLVEQSVNVALSVAERAVFLEKGEVRYEGRTQDLLVRPDVLRSVFLEGTGRALAGRASRNGRCGRVESAEVDVSTESTSTAVLRIDGLDKSYGGIEAVSGVSLSVAPGEIVGIIGPNGAGKTTVFDLISGFVTPDAGRIHLAGDDITHLNAHSRAIARLGRSFQDAKLFPTMTVREALRVAFHRQFSVRDPVSPLVALPDQRREEELVSQRAYELLDLFGLHPHADKFLSELSTGTRRIVDLACAVAHDPLLLLLDEPSSGIAQRETEALAPLLTTLRDEREISLVVIEHDMPLITAISDRLLALDLGRVIAVGTPQAVVADPLVIAAYLGSDQRTIARSDLPLTAGATP
jgi:ABC-type branched-subunit amino acid transport system ATPase component